MIPINILSSKYTKYAAIGVLAVIILYFVFSSGSKYIKGLTAGQEDPDAVDSGGVDRSGGLAGATSGKNFTPEPYAKELFDALDGVFVGAGTKEAAAKRFFELTRNQKIEVWNYWNRNFAPDMDNETIWGAMLDENLTPQKYYNPAQNIKSYWQQTLDYFESDSKLNKKTI